MPHCVDHARQSWGIPPTYLSSHAALKSVIYLRFQGLIPQLEHHWFTTISCVLMKYLLLPPVRQFSGVYYSFVKFSNKGFCVFFPLALLKLKQVSLCFPPCCILSSRCIPCSQIPTCLIIACCPTHLQTALYNGIYKRLNNCLCACVLEWLPAQLTIIFLLFPRISLLSAFAWHLLSPIKPHFFVF